MRSNPSPSAAALTGAFFEPSNRQADRIGSSSLPTRHIAGRWAGRFLPSGMRKAERSTPPGYGVVTRPASWRSWAKMRGLSFREIVNRGRDGRSAAKENPT